MNLCIKIVMIPLFLVVVGDASLEVVVPMMSKLDEAKNLNKLLDFLEEQHRQSNVHLTLLQDQKTNLALAVKHQQQVSDLLVTELKKQSSSPWMLWVVILFFTFLRLSVQLTNLVFAHSLGLMWTGGNKGNSAPAKDQVVKPTNSNFQIKQQKILQYLK